MEFEFSAREREREMMMIGEPGRRNPTVQVPPWDPYEDATAVVHPPYSSPIGDCLAALHRYLPSNEPDPLVPEPADPDLLDEPFNDDFRMYVFKVKRCPRGRSHDWTMCPFAHPGEKARRRDPRRFQYSGTACPDFRKGVCKKGDSCEFAHGVFECWLHPECYRTQPCKDGDKCSRRICFFAHSPDQLRVVVPQQQSPGSAESSYSSPGGVCPDSHYPIKAAPFLSSPTSILTSPSISPPSDSPPISPNGLTELVASMRGLSFGKTKLSPRAHFASGFGQIRCSILRPGSYADNIMPSTPTQSSLGGFDLWENPFKEEPAMERVESGRDIRARMYARLRKQFSLDRVEPPSSGHDVGWTSELVK